MTFKLLKTVAAQTSLIGASLIFASASAHAEGTPHQQCVIKMYKYCTSANANPDICGSDYGASNCPDEDGNPPGAPPPPPTGCTYINGGYFC